MEWSKVTYFEHRAQLGHLGCMVHMGSGATGPAMPRHESATAQTTRTVVFGGGSAVRSM